MAVQFPLFPDDVTFYDDNRQVMNNNQIYTRRPERGEEISLTQFTDSILTETRSSTRKILDSNRKSYSSVKRSLGSAPVNVNTNEKVTSYKRSAIEESKERARRATSTVPRRPKEYVYPTERIKQTLHAKKAEEPLINNERMEEYRRRTAQQVPADKAGLEPSDRPSRDPFDRETKDYFRQKRDRLFDRGV